MTSLRHPRALATAALLAMGSAWSPMAHAIFGDDEARRAIIELRQQVDANKAANAAAERGLRESDASIQRSMLELANQIEQLRGEIARLRGQNEQLAREVSELQRAQKDAQAGVDERLRQFEPVKVELDGRSFNAQPAEKADYDAAMATLRRSDFPAAVAAYSGFLRKYPSSGYTPVVLYWLGNAQYAARAYKDAVDTHQRLVREFPDHPRTPEAMLAMANSQVELKDPRGARKTLEDLVKAHPQSEAASAAKERLARLK
ncbi:MAG: tol-pal system protein YbgF [Hydrogenophaga sp.]|uniref:Cell division coordinator CpoB n=1 Tax=Hydrogenophaga crocea TaxID=2716225 RepID=A0A6G8IF55_9BURK|nr:MULTISPECIES: tol-pal system protein YbgF [Hydrogenophaga]MBL0944088.1 tol-pal system protein YbgF [Hydrogenophaga sp.]QIM51827.1 tol-pal system protein YbgF [Hydrogenophaga crocea]